MGLPTLNKFLCCCSLEAGGLFLGYLTAVISGLGILIFASSLIFLLTSDSFSDDDTTVIIVVFVIYLLYLGLLFYAGIQLVKGTKNKNHVQMKLYLVLMGVGLVLTFLQIFIGGSSTIVSSIIGAIISLYLFMCVYSLYQKTKIARANAGTEYSQHPANLYPAQSGMIYSTQATNNGGMIYNHQNQAHYPGPMYPNQQPSYPGFVNTLNPNNSGTVETGGKV